MLRNRKLISVVSALSFLLISTTGPAFSAGGKNPPVQLKSPQNIVVTPTLPVGDFTVSWSAVPNASSYTVRVYNASGKTLASPPITSATSVLTVTRSINTSYRVSIQAIGNGTTYLNSPESGKYSVTTFASTYGISWLHNGFGGSSLTPGPTTYTTAASIGSLPATTTRAGYTFDGWWVDSGFSGSAITSSYTPASPYGAVTFYAKWNTTVTFGGNTSDGGATSAQTAAVATALTSNGFTKTGYTFAGWNTQANGSGTPYANNASYPFSGGAATLYAQWTANTNNAITWDDQSATSASSGGSSVYTTATAVATIPTTPPIKTGYSFGGWFTQTAGAGTQVTDGSYTPASPYGAVTFYAKWEAVTTNAITWDDQSATSASSGGSSVYTTATAVATIPTTPPIKTGYSFGGWFTQTAGAGTQVTDGSYTPASPYGAVTFYAKWNTTVTFDGNTADGGSTASQTASVATPLTINGFTLTNFTFTGWNTLADGSGTGYADTASYPFSGGAATLYAQWTAVGP